MKSGITILYNLPMRFTLNKNNKFLIILMYYNRPEGLVRSLESIRNQSHRNWHVAFIDDGSDLAGQDIVKDYFTEEELKKVTFYNTNDTREIKKSRALAYKNLRGSDDRHSGMWLNPMFNRSVRENEHDVALFLCDDDLLQEHYLFNLNKFYNENLGTEYSYSLVILFDERYHNWKDMTEVTNRFFCMEPIHPFFRLDTSQVSWRSSAYLKDNIWFDEEFHIYFDAYWYKRLFEKYGPCRFNKIVGQYKNFDKDCFHL